jgi:hypothetical protein
VRACVLRGRTAGVQCVLCACCARAAVFMLCASSVRVLVCDAHSTAPAPQCVCCVRHVRTVCVPVLCALCACRVRAVRVMCIVHDSLRCFPFQNARTCILF